MIRPPLRRPPREQKPVVDRMKPGEVLRDRYRIVRLIGRGGMGEVYEAIDLEAGERVALKTVLAKFLGSSKVIARFRREIDLSRRISHPNVLRIHDVFELAPQEEEDADVPEAPVPCMVMEYLQGETLADRLEKGRLVPPDEARDLAAQMARGLAAAHRAEVIHRDLKPDNIFLVSGENSTRVVLTDFGVARPNTQEDESFTATDVIVGTPTYMAPEQLELEEALPASDIYTLGLVIYEMITGKFPFEGETAIQVVFMRVKQEPVPPRQYMPELSEAWEDLILKCLERDPTERFTDADQIADLLEGRDVDLEPAKARSWWPF